MLSTPERLTENSTMNVGKTSPLKTNSKKYVESKFCTIAFQTKHYVRRLVPGKIKRKETRKISGL